MNILETMRKNSLESSKSKYVYKTGGLDVFSKRVRYRFGCSMIKPQSTWKEFDAKDVNPSDLINIMKNYSDMGMTLYIGSDSMLYNKFCVFSCIVAVHSNKLQIANYYFQKEKLYDKKYKKLENKIMKEIQISIEAAQFLKEKIPSAHIEIHVDIGDTSKNATRHLVDSAKGWVKGMGFDVKIKPNSWASSVADWHTK